MARDIEGLLRQQAALARFGSFAFQETDLTKILNEAARICADSLSVGYCKVCQYRKEQDDLLIVAGYGWDPGIVGKIVSKADESSPQGRAFVTAEPVIILNLKEANDYKPPLFYADHGIVSTIDIIVRTHDGLPFGVLEIDSADEHAYDEHDIDFLTGFANVLAEAVATTNRNQLLQDTIKQMKALVAEKDALLAERSIMSQELQHRVRNNMQLVNGMLADQLKQTHDDGAQKGLRGIIRRVMTMGQVYDHLLGVGMTGKLDFGAYVERLCANLPELQATQAYPVSLICDARTLVMDLASVTALGLVVSELVSNSYEHAFHSRGGTIRVTVGPDGSSGHGIITVQDDGSGYSVVAETKRRGIGLVRRLMEQVNGTLDVNTTAGTIWTLRVPVDEPTTAPAGI